jgi:hypothetical protein
MKIDTVTELFDWIENPYEINPCLDLDTRTMQLESSSEIFNEYDNIRWNHESVAMWCGDRNDWEESDNLICLVNAMIEHAGETE